MSNSPYTEGWPKKRPISLDPDELEGRWSADNLLDVVPLSDAERLRQALEHLYDQCAEGYFRRVIRAALNPEPSE